MKVEHDEASSESGEMKRFSRRHALRIFGGAGLGMLLTILASPVSIAGQTKKKQATRKSAQKDNLQARDFIVSTAGFLPANLRRAGIARGEITDIVFSHAHFDHIGGTIDAANKFNYPNARYRMSRIEWEKAINPTEFFGEAKLDAATSKALSDAIKHNLPPLKDRIALFETDAEIAPGITAAITAYAHTPGHACYQVKSGNESLLFTGDLIHHAAVQFARPEWSIFGDSYPQEAIAQRKQILDRVVDERLLMGSHLPFPGIGHVRAGKEPTSYEWIPVEWQWQG